MYSTRTISVEAPGELAELKDNINSMVESLRDTTRANVEQDWLKTNLAHINSLMQGQRDLTTVAGVILDDLVPLVRAQYGTFFLADAGDAPRRQLEVSSRGTATAPAVRRNTHLVTSSGSRWSARRRVRASRFWSTTLRRTT